MASKDILFRHLNFHPPLYINFEEYEKAMKEIMSLIDEELALLKHPLPTTAFLHRRYNYFFPGCTVFKLRSESNVEINFDRLRGKYHGAKEGAVLEEVDEILSFPGDGFIAYAQPLQTGITHTYDISYVAFHENRPDALIHKIIEYHLYVRKEDKIWPRLDRSLLSLTSIHPSTIEVGSRTAVYSYLLTTIHHISILLFLTVIKSLEIPLEEQPNFLKHSGGTVFPYLCGIFFPSWTASELEKDEVDVTSLASFRVGEAYKLIGEELSIVARPLEFQTLNHCIFLLSAPEEAAPMPDQGMQLLQAYFQGDLFDFKKLDFEIYRAFTMDTPSIISHMFRRITDLLISFTDELLKMKRVLDSYAFMQPTPKWPRLREQTHARISKHSSQVAHRFESARTRTRVYEQDALQIWRVVFPTARILTHDQIIRNRQIASMDIKFLDPALDLFTRASIRFRDASEFRLEELGGFLDSYMIGGEAKLMAVYPGLKVQPITPDLLEKARQAGIGIDDDKH